MVIFFLLFLFTNSTFAFRYSDVGKDENDDYFKILYSEALKDAKFPTLGKVVTTLTPLRIENQNLKFDNEGRVLLASVTMRKDFPNNTVEVVLKEDTWFTAFPELKNNCQEYSGKKSLRIFQALGMPPNTKDDGVAEVYVDLKDIFRPCPDPEISDMECQINIPLINKKKPLEQEIPWYCPKENEKVSQASGEWVNVMIDHLIWMCNNWNASYTRPEVYDNYPWTALGYTYDWGNSENHIGFSEFVVKAGTKVFYKRKMSIDDYCSDENL